MEVKGGARELRNFALTMFFALGILGTVLFWRKGGVGFVLWVIGTAALLIGWLRPGALKPAYQYWMKLALGLGFLSSHLILALLYYLMFTPIGLVMRLLGKNPLALRIEKNSESYWIKREKRNEDKQGYEKMF